MALQPRIREFPPIDGFSMWNGAYQSVDAEVLWAILRELKPARVVQADRSRWAGLIIDAAFKGDQSEVSPEDLEARDVVFVMRARPSIVLDVLPRLAPGVMVHFHDVTLPWEGGSGQDLLQAYLSGNADWEVILGLHDLARTEPDLVKRVVPSWRGDTAPSAFWLRRC
jgi:hypothetical protein